MWVPEPPECSLCTGGLADPCPLCPGCHQSWSSPGCFSIPQRCSHKLVSPEHHHRGCCPRSEATCTRVLPCTLATAWSMLVWGKSLRAGWAQPAHALWTEELELACGAGQEKQQQESTSFSGSICWRMAACKKRHVGSSLERCCSWVFCCS